MNLTKRLDGVRGAVIMPSCPKLKKLFRVLVEKKKILYLYQVSAVLVVSLTT